MDYERDIEIDSESLDLEWLDQPTLMLKYSRICADLEADKDRAKEKVDLVKSELDKDIRSHPEKYDIEKITDKVVEMTVPMQKRYKDVIEEYIDAKHEYNVAIGAVKAFDGRKVALENLVKLHGQQYFAGPKVPRDLTWERKQKKEQQNVVHAGIASRMQRKRNDN